MEYKKYEESNAVKQAKANLDAQLAKKPGAYQSQWQTQLDDTLKKIQNREKFNYNINGDALYQSYKDKFVRQGQQAMQDTMGQAAALTGGYGSTYGQNAGQQAYNAHLQNLGDVVPELYEIARSRYDQEGADLLNMYGILGDNEAQDYGRWQDTMNAWQGERDYLAGLYDSERAFDYGKYRDAVADDQWAQQMALSRAKLSGGSGGDDDTKWGKGISTERNKSVKGGDGGALKGSAWDYSKNNMSRLLATGDFASAEKYMDMIVDELNQSQYNEIISLMNQYGYNFR